MDSERELAFIAVHRDSYPRVYRYVRRRVESPELAEELAADVFRVVWQKWHDQPHSDIAWLLTVARNLIGNAYRSRDRLVALQAKLRASAELRSGAESEDLAVHDAMAALRDSERDILQLAYWDELSVTEIAGVLQCSKAAAKVRLHRARAAFRKQMPATPGPGRHNSLTQKMGA
ncbi:RNA polymerase sigma factor [Arthrobacter globiformis]|uniref:RNA polymerase sigma factor n=1 Tax=Arthrobacter globiformis TaxID=1665 RepID=UPI0027938789|nr:sigma-70 family RNA polymerase sigma factor [Arthrobacter globiformis]MDQ0617868.1 RNA polymerase sigma factor (sigma-70 family) [Arthrobacter globiformis]